MATYRYLSGELMISLSLLSSCALAQSASPQSPGAGCAIGALAGGLLLSHSGHGDAQGAATAVGAVLGCATGHAIQNASVPAYATPQPGYAYQGPIYSMTSASFAPTCIAQWHGTLTPIQPITPQGSMAMDKAIAMLRDSGHKVALAEVRYAQAYDALIRARADLGNPQTAILMGVDLESRARRADQFARQASNDREVAERNYFADVAMTLDVCEYSAVRGEDVTAFAPMEGAMTLPVAVAHTYTDRRDGRQITIYAAAPIAAPMNGLPSPVAAPYPMP